MSRKFALWLMLVTGINMIFSLQSSSFNDNEFIPAKYTCDGANISPPLKWSIPPEGTKSLILIMDDPDAPNGTWDHWIVYNIPANVYEFPENINQLPDEARLALNSWKQPAYGGPCPPSGTHRYSFKLYALDTMLNLNNRPGKQDIENAMNKHILAKSVLIGKYKRGL